MTGRVLSVNVGRAEPTPASSTKTTGIAKSPVPGITVSAPGRVKGPSGVAGDHIGDPRHHGGEDQAVYAFAREELDHWATQLGRDLRNGDFGENLTTAGLDVDGAELGELWRVGVTLLRVCGPRIPCRTFAHHMDRPRWVRTFAARGRTGAYLAVVEPGKIRPGDEVAVHHRPGHGITVPDYFRALMGDRDQARRILDTDVLTERRRSELGRLSGES